MGVKVGGQRQPKEDVTRLVEEAEKVNITQMNEEGLKKLLGSLSAKYKRNMDLRTKYRSMPEKFADSEADLDAELKNVQMITAYPDLLLSFVGYRGVELLMDVLSHENTDICINVINIFSELTEGDVILAHKDNIQFVEYMMSKGVPLLLIDTIARLSTGRDEDLAAIYNILSTLQNITDYKPEMCDFYFAQSKLMKWLTECIVSEADKELTETRVCACELYSIIVQRSKDAQQKVGKSQELVDIMKEINRRCSGGEYEYNEDYVENLFNVVCGCLLLPENKDFFRECEGVELMLKLMKCGLKNRRCALKALDFALAGNPANCKVFIGALGLSYVFSMFMRKGYSSKTGKEKVSESEQRKDEEHCMSILSSLLKYCGSVDKDRLVFKFRENSGEKLQRLAELYSLYVDSYEKYLDHMRETQEGEKENVYLEELGNGIFTFQLIAIVLGCLITSKDAAVLEILNKIVQTRRIRMEMVVSAVTEYIDHIDKTEGEKEREELGSMLAEVKGMIKMQDPKENGKPEPEKKAETETATATEAKKEEADKNNVAK
ncbi:MAG: beta-catenin-like protein 1 [Candidatus Pacebacteria bacterium]|nr:beta-catenin-like protein 1 [Candidatus Paceibacterota bacterium]